LGAEHQTGWTGLIAHIMTSIGKKSRIGNSSHPHTEEDNYPSTNVHSSNNNKTHNNNNNNNNNNNEKEKDDDLEDDE